MNTFKNNRISAWLVLLLLVCNPVFSQVTPYKNTANNSVPAYNGDFEYGVNPGFYDNGWTDVMVAEIAKYAGANSLRLALPSTFLDKYGMNIRKNEFNHYTGVLNMRDLVLFIEGPAAHEKLKTSFGPCGESKVFDNLYLPIWDNGENGTPINEKNYFAAYVYKVIQHYGHHIKFWEIWNEPDYSFASGAWQIRGQPGNWWENNPSPCDLKNLQAPIYYYIRMMRVAYEVIKTYSPTSFICTGGIGYESFLDVLLRNTDNPDNGKVTAEFPLKGGAYFDVMSFHTYPHYQLTKWNYAQGKFESKRHSDEAANQFVAHAKIFDSVMMNYGYGRNLPRKHIICTETNLPRKQFNDYLGTIDAQRNFTIKLLAQAQANNIRQVHMYQTGDTEPYATATSPFNLMGFYENLKTAKYGSQKITEQGIAHKTTAELLNGFDYDAAYTGQFKNNPNAEVVAFKNDQGQRRLVMWAITKIDRSETAQADYEFPAAITVNSIHSYAWNYSVDRSKKQTITGRKIALTASPVFVTINEPIEIENQRPAVKAGNDTTITLPQPNFAMKATARDPDGKVDSYQWTALYGSKIGFANPTSPTTVLTNLVDSGTFYLELKAIDNFGLDGRDTIKLTVLPEPYRNKPPVAKAGPDIRITLPTSTAKLDAGESYDVDSRIIHYLWTQIAGPAVKFTNAWSADPTVSGLTTVGTYTFVVRVTDEERTEGSDTMNVIVSKGDGTPPPGNTNKPPVAVAGPDINLTLPTSSAKLNGKGSYDSDSQIMHYYWYQIQGPTVKFTNAWSVDPTVSGLTTVGTYRFVLRVTDMERTEGRDTISVIVNTGSGGNPGNPPPGENKPPVAEAGPNRYFSTTPSSVEVDGSQSFDPDGNITSYSWSKVSGPAGVFMYDTWKNKLTLRNFGSKGVYRFRLTVKDNKNATHSDEMEVYIYHDAPTAAAAVPAGNSKSPLEQDETVVFEATASPNPVSTFTLVSVKSVVQGKLSMQLIGSGGQVLKNMEFNKDSYEFQHRLDASALTKGVHFLMIRLGDKSETIKLQKF